MIRNFLMAVTLVGLGSCDVKADPPPMPLPMITAGTIRGVTSQPRLYSDNVVFWGSNISGVAPGQYGNMPKDIWIHVNLSPFGVSPNAKFVYLACEGLITGYPYLGTEASVVAPVDAQTTIGFRRPSDASAKLADGSVFMGQLIEPLRGGGIRSNAGWFIPVELDTWGHASFDYSAYYPDGMPLWTGDSNGGPAFGWNCSLQLSLE